MTLMNLTQLIQPDQAMNHSTKEHIVDILELSHREFAFSALTLLVWVRPVWVVRYWHGYLSGVRCKWFAYVPAGATATHHLLLPVKSRWFKFLVPAYPGCPEKKAIKQM